MRALHIRLWRAGLWTDLSFLCFICLLLSRTVSWDRSCSFTWVMAKIPLSMSCLYCFISQSYTCNSLNVNTPHCNQSLLTSSSARSTLLMGISCKCSQGTEQCFLSSGRGKGSPEEGFTRKPQVLNSLSEDYWEISSEPDWQRNMPPNTTMQLLSAVPSKTRYLTFFSSSLSLVFWNKGRGMKRAMFLLSIKRCGAEDLCQRAELWKWNVRMADHRGQRKMIFSSLRLPRPEPLLWGLLLLTGNRSRRLLCFCCIPHTHTHTHTHTYTQIAWYTCLRLQYIRVHSHTHAFKLSIIPPSSKPLWQLVKPDATCKASLSAGSLSSPVSGDTRWPGGGVLL